MSKHLSLDERLDIEKYLSQNKSFKEIGKLIDKNCTTISREIEAIILLKTQVALAEDLITVFTELHVPIEVELVL